jgi:SAM-dependent methyltransferase
MTGDQSRSDTLPLLVLATNDRPIRSTIDLRMNTGESDQRPAQPSAITGGLTDWEVALEGSFQRYMAEGQREILLKTHAQAKSPGLLIDFGCGPGRWTKLFMDLGWDAICLDIDASSLGRCQVMNPRAKCIHSQRELHQLPAGDGDVDLVLCIGVYRTLESEWFLPEVRRVLKPGGLLSGAFFNRMSGRGLYRSFMDGLFGGQRAYQESYLAWRRRAQRDRFRFVYERGYCWFPVPAFSNSPLVPLLTGLERACGLQRLPALSPWVAFLAEFDSTSDGLSVRD